MTLVTDELPVLVRLLREGAVVACPTETFVGLLADARNAAAVARVCALKGRAADAPIGVLLPDAAALSTVAAVQPPLALELAARYWPGPLTLVLPVLPGLPAALSREGKIGARVPGASPALALVQAFGAALTATSANRSGEPAARSVAEVFAAFPEGLDAIVPGDAPGGLASTVLDVTGTAPVVVRAGAVADVSWRARHGAD